jgi:hypothetical protein
MRTATAATSHHQGSSRELSSAPGTRLISSWTDAGSPASAGLPGIAGGALYYDAVWMTGLHGKEGFQVEVQHSHDFDEILGFFGSNKDNYRDLNSEIELWLEDEQYFITKSALIFVPKGMKHLPLYFRKVGSPVLFFTAGNGTSYTRSTGNE